MTKSDVKKYLQDLNELELVHLVNEVLIQRRDEKSYKNGDFQYDDVFCVASCSFGSTDGVVDDQATVELYAPVVTEESASEAGLCNFSECGRCKTPLISEGKVANCPVCKEKVFLT